MLPWRNQIESQLGQRQQERPPAQPIYITPQQPTVEYVTRGELQALIARVEQKYGIEIDNVEKAVAEAKADVGEAKAEAAGLRERIKGFVTSDNVRSMLGDVVGRVREDDTDAGLIEKIKAAVKAEGKERIVAKVTGEDASEGGYSVGIRDVLLTLILGGLGVTGWQAFAAKKVAGIAMDRIHNRVAGTPQPNQVV